MRELWLKILRRTLKLSKFLLQVTTKSKMTDITAPSEDEDNVLVVEDEGMSEMLADIFHTYFIRGSLIRIHWKLHIYLYYCDQHNEVLDQVYLNWTVHKGKQWRGIFRYQRAGGENSPILSMVLSAVKNAHPDPNHNSNPNCIPRHYFTPNLNYHSEAIPIPYPIFLVCLQTGESTNNWVNIHVWECPRNRTTGQHQWSSVVQSLFVIRNGIEWYSEVSWCTIGSTVVQWGLQIVAAEAMTVLVMTPPAKIAKAKRFGFTNPQSRKERGRGAEMGGGEESGRVRIIIIIKRKSLSRR